MNMPSYKSIRRAYDSGRKDAQRFGLGLALLFSVLAAAAFFRGRPDIAQRYYPVALALAALALLFPPPLWPLQRLAALIIRGIAWLNTQVMLALVFYLVFAPVGIVLRILGRDMLDRKIQPNRDSYWIPREGKDYRPEDDEKQY